MSQRFQHYCRRHPERTAKPVAAIALPIGVHRNVHGQDQHAHPRPYRALHQVGIDVLVARAIHLEPDVIRRDIDRFFQRCIAGTGKQERHVGLARCGRLHQVGVGTPQPGQPGGRDADGAVVPVAEQGHRLVQPADIAQIPRHQIVPAKGLAVARHATLVVGAAVDEVECDARQLSARQLTQIVQIDGGLNLHGGAPNRDAIP
ncbi:hypothetical protein D3C71_1245000 [compost metagenome]